LHTHQQIKTIDAEKDTSVLKFLNLNKQDLFLSHLNPQETQCVKVVVEQTTPLKRSSLNNICSENAGK